MLKHFAQTLIEPPPVYDVATHRKARLLSIFLLVMIAIFSIVDLVSTLTIPDYQIPWYGYILLFVAYGLNRLPYYRISAALCVFMFPAVVFANILGGESDQPAVTLGFLLVGIVLAGIFLSRWGIIILAVCDVIGIILLPRLSPESIMKSSDIILPVAVFLIGTVLVVISSHHRDQVESARQSLLRQSEENYRMLFDEAPDGIMIISPQNLILMANSTIYQMTGYAPHEVIGHAPVEFLAPEDLIRRPPRDISQIRVPGSTRRERVIVCKDQSRINVIISSSYMPSGNFQYILQDVTERIKIEEALRLSEQKFAKSFHSSPDAVTISAIATGEFMDVNDGFCRMSGYTREESLGHSAEELGIWENIEHRRQMTELLKSKGWVREFETTLKRRSGERLVCLLSVELLKIGNEECMIVVTRDVTERKRMEVELRLSEERYRMVSSVISDYTFFTKVEDDGRLRIAWVGGAFEAITGYTPAEFDSRGGWVFTLHPDDVARDNQDMEILRGNQRVISELRTIRKDGSICWVRVYAHPMWDADTNQLAGIYGAVQDINKQKQIEHERESLINELETKNAELEQFTYMVSHDLKAPLITIKGFMGFLAEDARNGNITRLEADIIRINEAADKMHALLNDLLELSRIGRLMNDPEPVDCNVVIQEVEKILTAHLQGQNIRLQINGQLPLVRGDRQRLIEVFQNLVDNAAKFMGDQLNPQIEIGQYGKPQNGFCTFYIRDNGIGIAPQFHERIFGLFNRLDPKLEGTGIGLAIVKRIVEFHGGRIWLDSDVGHGATFYFNLPQA